MTWPGVWLKGGNFFFHFFFQFLFYSVMQEHTGERDGDVRGRGAWHGGGVAKGRHKIFFQFFFNFFSFSNSALWWRQYECSSSRGKISKIFKKKFYLIFQY